MAEGPTAKISRRSIRYFTESEGHVENGSPESQYSTSNDETDKEKSQREARTSSTNIEAAMMPMVDLGKDLSGLFPALEDMGKHVTISLQVAKASSKSKVDGRPLNFGTVLPNAIYRSSFPQTEDFQFLGTLGLKTIVSLVNKEFSPQFRDFTRIHGIKHCIIEMHSTKKVKISGAIMQSIMEVVLDQENHPVLIHCNQGKHRTGCAVAVIRHVAGWKADEIVEEYQGHAEPKVRECDVKYINNYEVSNLQGLFTKKETFSLGPTLNMSKMLKLVIGTVATILIWTLTWLFWNERELRHE